MKLLPMAKSAAMAARFVERSVVHLSIVLWVFSAAMTSQAQMMSPLSGQGYPPGLPPDYGLYFMDSTTGKGQAAGVNPFYTQLEFPEVYVSCFLDRLLKVDEQAYGFEAVIFMRLSWTDSRAMDEIYNRTAETYALKKDNDCLRPCHPQYRTCCDTVWLPGLDLVNVWGLPQERVDFEIISVQPLNLTNVQWIRRFNGVFYTPMNFRRFPFDRQVLVIEFWGQSCCHILRESTVATKLVQTRGIKKDPDISSWRVLNVTIETYVFNLTDLISAGTESAPGEPYPMRPGAGKMAFSVGASTSEQPDSVRILIIIKRLSWYYVASYVFPVVLCVLLSWWTFWISPRNIDTRMSVLIALFLSLTALQFTISNELPASSYITAMGWILIVSYILIVGATAETMLVYWVFRWYAHADDRRSEVDEQSLRTTIDNSTPEPDKVPEASPPENVPEKPPDEVAVEGGSTELKGSCSTGDSSRHYEGEASLIRSPQLRRRNTVLRKLWDSTLSITPLAFTLSRSLLVDSSLQRDLDKAKRVISRIETFAMWAFPSLYILVLLIIFLTVN